MPDSQMRERGAEELARWIVERIDQRQLGLPSDLRLTRPMLTTLHDVPFELVHSEASLLL